MSELTKIAFILEEDAWHGVAVETLWSEQIDDELFELENSPFFAFGVSYGDIVRAVSDGDQIVFEEVVRRSGRSTIRLVVFDEQQAEFDDEWWDKLVEFGCTYEGANQYSLYSVDIPPKAPLDSLIAVLDAGEAAEVWDWEEGFFAAEA